MFDFLGKQAQIQQLQHQQLQEAQSNGHPQKVVSLKKYFTLIQTYNEIFF